jgi:hypothetical protein
LSLTGFEPQEIDEFLFGDFAGGTDEEAPAVPEHAVTRAGDLWTLGAHRVLCGVFVRRNQSKKNTSSGRAAYSNSDGG